MRLALLTRSAVVLLACAACADDRTPTTPPPTPEPPQAPTPIGAYEITLTGIGTEQITSVARSVSPESPSGPRLTMTGIGAGLTLEQVSSSSLIDGARATGGHRYVTATYRIRNGTGVALNNLTLMMVSRSGAIAGTPISQLRKFDGTNAAPSIATKVAPTGAVTLGSDLVSMQAVYPDVVQVLTEAETAAIALPGDVTGIFPYGYMVRSAKSTVNRTLPATADPNQWDGLLTLSFRIPLQATSADDVFSITFQFLGVTDSETRLTETIEESQDTAAVRRLRDRATSLGATTVTVLNGSPATDPGVPDYPGQRQLCSVRTAGTAGAPITFINTPAGYTQIYLTPGGEFLDPCAAYFRSGSPARPALNNSFSLVVRAMDRYGNQKSVVDTVHLEEASGPSVVFNPAAALVAGQATIDMIFSGYGSAVIDGVGRRLRGTEPVLVAGVTRTWTAGAGTTDWHTNGNWSPAAVPGTLDSVYVPVAAPLDPALAANVQVEGVTVEDVATIALGAFNLTANANVTAGTTGGITNTSGTLFLAGTAKTVQGRLPRLRVTGTYSLTANATARAPIQVDAGRLTSSLYRLQADGN